MAEGEKILRRIEEHASKKPLPATYLVVDKFGKSLTRLLLSENTNEEKIAILKNSIVEYEDIMDGARKKMVLSRTSLKKFLLGEENQEYLSAYGLQGDELTNPRENEDLQYSIIEDYFQKIRERIRRSALENTSLPTSLEFNKIIGKHHKYSQKYFKAKLNIRTLNKQIELYSSTPSKIQ